MKMSKLIILILLLFVVPFASAQSIDVAALQREIDDKNQKIQALNIEIIKYQNLALQASDKGLSLKQQITILEQSRKALTLEITKIQTKIDATNLNIKQLVSKIYDSENKIDTLHDGLEKSIREISQNDTFHVVINLLNNKNFSDFFGKLDEQNQFNASIQDKVSQIQSEKRKLENNKTEVEKTKQQLANLQSELTGKKKVVEVTKTEQQKTLTDTKSEEAAYQKLLADATAKKVAFEKEIFDYESKIKFQLDPNSIPQSGSSPFMWPISNVRITQLFGKTVGAKKLYTSGSHNGMDFGVPIGTEIKAMSSGVVAGTGDTDVECRKVSFGRWILIKFNNGLAATYGHLSVISVKAGDKVDAGQVIGYSGNTGYSTGPHLHLSVYVASAVNVVTRPSASCPGRSMTMPVSAVDAYLDPMLYLPPNK